MNGEHSPTAGSEMGARCALHPVQPALAVCGRCGNYMCAECTEGGQHGLCPPCRSRTGLGAFPYDRASFDLGNVMSFCFERYKSQWVVPTLAVVLLWMVSILFSAVDTGIQLGITAADSSLSEVGLAISVALNIVATIVQTGLQLGVMAINLRILQGHPVEIGALFGQIPRLPAAILQFLVVLVPIGLLVGAPVGAAFAVGFDTDLGKTLLIAMGVVAVIAIPIAIYVGLGLAFMQIELVQDPDVGALEAIQRSWRIASGYRLWLLAMGFALVALLFAGLLACCVGMIPAVALGGMITAGVYLALRNGAEL